jgi:hypothetical protein
MEAIHDRLYAFAPVERYKGLDQVNTVPNEMIKAPSGHDDPGCRFQFSGCLNSSGLLFQQV